MKSIIHYTKTLPGKLLYKTKRMFKYIVGIIKTRDNLICQIDLSQKK